MGMGLTITIVEGMGLTITITIVWDMGLTIDILWGYGANPLIQIVGSAASNGVFLL